MNSILFCAISLVSSQFILATHGDIDTVAIDFESDKVISFIDPSKEEQNYMALRAQIHASESVDDYFPADQFEVEFCDDDSSLPTEQTSEADPWQDRLLESERTILKKVREFVKSSQSFGEQVLAIYRAHQDLYKRKDWEFWPSDAALEIARHFRQQGNTGLAEEFYNLSLQSFRGQEDAIFLELGNTFLEYVNDLIKRTKPRAPTSELFSALMKAIRYNSYDTGDGGPSSIGEARNIELKKHRDLMVRWPLSPQNVRDDIYYGKDKLAQRLFGVDFVDTLLHDMEQLEKLWGLRLFNGKDSDKNILSVLQKLGFTCARFYYRKAPQYILVNQKGYAVRVKRNHQTQQWQFTVGIVMENPYLWRKNGQPSRAKMASEISSDESQFNKDSKSHTLLAEFQQNEIAKISYDEGMIQVLPASMSNRVWSFNGREDIDYWADVRQRQRQMTGAHRNMLPVGRYCKRQGTIDTAAIDRCCSEINRTSGEILR